MAKYKGRGLVVKRPGVLSKVQMLTLALGVGVFSLLPKQVRQLASGGMPPVTLCVCVAACGKQAPMKCCNLRGPRLNTNFSFSNFSGAPRLSGTGDS